MARAVRGSIEQHRTVAYGIGQLILLLEQFRGIKNNKKQFGTVLSEWNSKINCKRSVGSFRK